MLSSVAPPLLRSRCYCSCFISRACQVLVIPWAVWPGKSMHGYSRLGAVRTNGGSPPPSPRLRHGRNKSFGGGSGRGAKQNLMEKLVVLVVSAVFRRRGVLLFAPVLYISGLLLYMGSLEFSVKRIGRGGGGPQPPGSVYRSPQAFRKLWPFMEADSNETHNAVTFFPYFLQYSVFRSFWWSSLLLHILIVW